MHIHVPLVGYILAFTGFWIPEEKIGTAEETAENHVALTSKQVATCGVDGKWTLGKHELLSRPLTDEEKADFML